MICAREFCGRFPKCWLDSNSSYCVYLKLSNNIMIINYSELSAIPRCGDIACECRNIIRAAPDSIHCLCCACENFCEIVALLTSTL